MTNMIPSALLLRPCRVAFLQGQRNSSSLVARSFTCLNDAIGSNTSNFRNGNKASTSSLPNTATMKRSSNDGFSSLLNRSFHATSHCCNDDGDEGPEFVKDSLLDLVEREHEEEKMNQTLDMPEELVELKKKITTELGWKIVEDDLATSGSGMTRLVKNDAVASNLKVQLSFHCQDLVENEGPGSYTLDDEGVPQEDEEEASPVRFTVVAGKAGKTFLFGCLSSEGMVQLQSVNITQSDDDTRLLNEGTAASTEYQGPDYFELAEDLQTVLQEFVEKDLGVNEDVATFISMYADYKEQYKYVQFLKQAKNLLS